MLSACTGDKPLWQNVHLGESRDGASPAVPVPSADEGTPATSPDSIPKGQAPAWQTVHTQKDEPMWQKVNANRVGESPVLAAAESVEASPKVLDVAAASAPLWASVHLSNKPEGSKMWQTARLKLPPCAATSTPISSPPRTPLLLPLSRQLPFHLPLRTRLISSPLLS